MRNLGALLIRRLLLGFIVLRDPMVRMFHRLILAAALHINSLNDIERKPAYLVTIFVGNDDGEVPVL
jgi:hypothetical protein